MNNEQTKDKGTGRLLRAIVLSEIEDEYKELSERLTQEEFDGDLNLQITEIIIETLKKNDFPDDFWMSIFFNADDGCFLKEAVDRFDIQICIKLKKKISVPFPEDETKGGFYA